MKRAALTVVFLFLSSVAAAQEAYPSRPVKFVVPFPPGGPLDVPARLIAQKLTEHWGKPVLVENQVGASGSIGANAVARAAPDGYTLLVTVDIPLTMFPAVAKKLPYDPQADFKAVGAFARLQNALFVHPKVNVASARELVELAKKQPGKLSFSSAGIASPAHFGGELFKVIAGVDITHVPYKGAAPAITAAVSGEVDMMFGPDRRGRAARALGQAEGARRHRVDAVAAAAGREAARRAGIRGARVFQLGRGGRAGEDSRRRRSQDRRRLPARAGR